MNKTKLVICGVIVALALLGCTAEKVETPNTEMQILNEETATSAETVIETISGLVYQPGVSSDIEEETVTGGETTPQENEKDSTQVESPGSSTGNSGGNKNEKPEETTPPIEEPAQPEGGDDVPSPNEVTYEEYNAMSGEEQLAFFNSFESMEDFVAWYNAAKAKYEEENPPIDVGDGEIDAGDIIGGGN